MTTPRVFSIDARIPGKPFCYLGDSGEYPMFVPPPLRDSVVFLAVKTNPERAPKLGGTGFIVFIEVFEGNGVLYLVTAKHCIDAIKGESCDGKVYVRANTQTFGAQFFEVTLDPWRFHPTDERVDVAVMPIKFERPHIDHRAVPDAAFVTDEIIRKEQISPGDEIFMIGLFKEHGGQNRNIPIVRVGNIAAMPEEPVATRRGAMDAYLVECRSIKGLSGSPVFVHIDELSRLPPQHMIIGVSEKRISFHYLLGLMHGHWDTEDAAIVEDSSGRSVNVGIAIVVPAAKIREVLDHPDFVRSRNSELERLKAAKNLPVAD